jgi:hypothetical protein
MSKAKSSNWAKAPEAAKFVKAMRAVFGEDVTVLYVKEGSLELGESTDPNRQMSQLRDQPEGKDSGAEQQASRLVA